MNMNLIEFSNAVKEIVRGKVSDKTTEFLKTLPDGVVTKKFGFVLNGNIIQVVSPFRSLPAITKMVLRASEHDDYNYTIRVQGDGQMTNLAKRFVSAVDVDAAKKELLLGKNTDREFYEVVATPDFEIKYTEYEGTTIKANDPEMARKYFQSLMGLFPYVELEKQHKKVKMEFEFQKQAYKEFRKEPAHKGHLSCAIELDGVPAGTKGGSFIY